MEKKCKDIFLNNEVWVLTFGVAFQRANVYKPNVENAKKKLFKYELRVFIVKTYILENINTYVVFRNLCILKMNIFITYLLILVQKRVYITS